MLLRFADWCYENGKDKLTEVDPDNPDPEPGDEAYYSVFSSNTTTIAPGVSQTVNYALTRDDKQIVYYIATADLSRDDVDIYANYHANDPSQGWAMSRVTDQMAAAQKNIQIRLILRTMLSITMQWSASMRISMI